MPSCNMGYVIHPGLRATLQEPRTHFAEVVCVYPSLLHLTVGLAYEYMLARDLGCEPLQSFRSDFPAVRLVGRAGGKISNQQMPSPKTSRNPLRDPQALNLRGFVDNSLWRMYETSQRNRAKKADCKLSICRSAWPGRA